MADLMLWNHAGSLAACVPEQMDVGTITKQSKSDFAEASRRAYEPQVTKTAFFGTTASRPFRNSPIRFSENDFALAVASITLATFQTGARVGHKFQAVSTTHVRVFPACNGSILRHGHLQ